MCRLKCMNLQGKFAPQVHGAIILCSALWRSNADFTPQNYRAMQTWPRKSWRHSLRDNNNNNKKYQEKRLNFFLDFVICCKSLLFRKSIKPLCWYENDNFLLQQGFSKNYLPQKVRKLQQKWFRDKTAWAKLYYHTSMEAIII